MQPISALPITPEATRPPRPRPRPRLLSCGVSGTDGRSTSSSSSIHKIDIDAFNHRRLELRQELVDREDVAGWLEYEQDGRPKVAAVVSGKYLSIGRKYTNDLVLASPKISKQHLRLSSIRTDSNETLVSLHDLSTNGYTLNGVPNKKGAIVLNHGDGLELAGALERFTFFQHPHHRFEYGEDQRSAPKKARLEMPKVDASEMARSLSPEAVGPRIKVERVIGEYDIFNRRIGMGTFGIVSLARHKPSGKQVACKQIRRPKGCNQSLLDPRSFSALNSNEAQMAMEIRIGLELKHPNINVTWAAHEVPAEGSIFMFQELITGGDLFAYIDKHVTLSEPEVKFLAFQLCQALTYLHDLGISHRDIKPENILLKLNTASLPRVLLTDFGAAHCTRWQQGHGDQQVAAAIKRCSSWVGTNGYMSPEILRVIAKHQQMALGKMQRGVPEQEQERQKEEGIVYDGFKADCFALGVTLAICLTGEAIFSPALPDFVEGSSKSMARNAAKTIASRQPFFHPKHWAKVLEEGKRVILGLLEPSPDSRWTAQQVLESTWTAQDLQALNQLYDRLVVVE